MNREMTAMFPSGIRALIVDDDARFIKSSSMLLSILNIKVTSCRSPTSALKFFSGDKNKDVDVVLVNAEMATTCGFDFRGVVETDLRIPVIYFLSRDHVATGDEADELLRTLGDATYILRSPLEASEVCDLWMVIAWHKCCLEKKAKGADDGRRRVVPAATVQAYMAAGGGGGSSSNTTAAPVDEEREDHEDRVHFKVVGAGRRARARKRKSGCKTVAGGAGSSGTTVAGDQAAKRKGKMNVTAEHERHDVPSQQQPAVTATQKAALPLVPQQQQQQLQPAAATTIEATATTTAHWNQNQPTAAGNDIAPPTGVANMATTVTYEPEFSRDGDQHQHQHQQNVCPPQLLFGPFPYQGPQPPVLKQAMSVPPPRNSGTDAAAAMYNSSSALMALQRQHIGHGVAASRASEAMEDALNTNSSYINYSAAAAGQEVPNNGDDDFSAYSTSLMAPNNNQVLDMASNVNELSLTMAGGAFLSDANGDASFTAPQDLAAAMNGDTGLELDAMFSPGHYDNTMFPLEALLGLDEAPVYETGVDYQQGGAAGGGTAAGDDAVAGTSLIGGADDNLDVLNDYLFMDSAGDFNNGRE